MNTTAAINISIMEVGTKDVNDVNKDLRQILGRILGSTGSLTPTVGSLYEIFDLGLMTSDYQLNSKCLENAKVLTGEGYYDSLQHVRFHDVDGKPVAPGSSISAFHDATQRRLYIIVIREGFNIIVHDRYPCTGESKIVVMTAPTKFKHFVNMFPAWGDCAIDRSDCGRLFGFEARCADGTVYIPFTKTENKIKAALSLLNEIQELTEL